MAGQDFVSRAVPSHLKSLSTYVAPYTTAAVDLGSFIDGAILLWSPLLVATAETS